MLFNVHYGQVRFTSIDTGSKPLFRDKSPKGHISMVRIISPQGKIDHKGGYNADKMGTLTW